MLGTYKQKSSSQPNTKLPSKSSKPRTVLSRNDASGPKTRSASSRRAQEEALTITYMGRARSASESGPGTSSATKKVVSQLPLDEQTASSNSIFQKQDHSSSSLPSPDAASLPSSSLWTACNETVKEIGSIAKKENKYIRRLNSLISRRKNNYEKEFLHDEHLTLTAVRVLTNRNTWCLNSCHAYLGTITNNIVSDNRQNQRIALDALEAIADTMLEVILRFANGKSYRIGVDLVAEERIEKANECVRRFREIVKNRDSYYKQMDEDSVYKLDTILRQLKKA